jgi:hypothetical protein
MEGSPIDAEHGSVNMAKIQVVSETGAGESAEVLMSEHVAPPLLESEHYSAQLIERVRWATQDADEREHEDR